ncbi:MAG: hypothetical protein AAF628_06890 [Planctomycetota bacterium]
MRMIRAGIETELRVHRGALLVIAGLGVTVAALLGAVLPRGGASPLEALAYGVAVPLIGLLVAVACDSVPRELRAGRFGLLLRLPGGLWAAGAAKLSTLALAAVMLAAAAATAGGLAVWLVHDVPGGTAFAVARSAGVLGAALGLGLAMLGLAVSTWLPRGSLAVVVTLLVGAAWGLPFSMSRLHNAWFEPPAWEGNVLALAVIPALALGTAWLSLAGRRWSRGPLRAARHGLPSAVAGGALLFGWHEARAEAWDVVRVERPDFRIRSGMVGVEAELAFLNVGRGDHGEYCLVVDLATGLWRRVPGTRFGSAAGLLPDTPVTQCTPGQHEALALWHQEVGPWRPKDDPWPWVFFAQLIDGRTGDAGGVPDLPSVVVCYAKAKVHRSLRATTPVRTIDGRRAWFAAGPQIEEGKAWISRPWRHGRGPWVWRGDAVLLDGFTYAYDPHLGREVAFENTPLHGGWCRPGHWLVPRRDPAELGYWDLVDPATGTATPCEAMNGVAWPIVNLDGGAIVVLTDDGRLLIIEPEAGRRRPVRTPDGYWVEAERVDRPAQDTPVFTPGRQALLTIRSRHGGRSLGRLDAATATLVFAGPPDRHQHVLACPNEDEVLVHTKNTVERWHFGSDDYEVLFPRLGVQ